MYCLRGHSKRKCQKRKNKQETDSASLICYTRKYQRMQLDTNQTFNIKLVHVFNSQHKSGRRSVEWLILLILVAWRMVWVNELSRKTTFSFLVISGWWYVSPTIAAWWEFNMTNGKVDPLTGLGLTKGWAWTGPHSLASGSASVPRLDRIRSPPKRASN